MGKLIGTSGSPHHISHPPLIFIYYTLLNMPKEPIKSMPKSRSADPGDLSDILQQVNHNIHGPNGPVITEKNAYKFFGVPSPAELLEQLTTNMERSFSLFDGDEETPNMPLLPEIWVQIACHLRRPLPLPHGQHLPSALRQPELAKLMRVNKVSLSLTIADSSSTT